MKYQCIELHKQEFPVVTMCRVLGVSESGDDAWRKRPMCQRKREDARLTAHIPHVFVSRRGSMAVPACTPNSKSKAGGVRANGLRGSCKKMG
jgi:hypothetical protein